MRGYNGAAGRTPIHPIFAKLRDLVGVGSDWASLLRRGLLLNLTIDDPITIEAGYLQLCYFTEFHWLVTLINIFGYLERH